MAYTPVQEMTRSDTLRAAEKYGIPANIALALVGVESNYGEAIGPSTAGAVGPAQILPSTAADIARDHNRQYGTKWTAEQVLQEPKTNIDAGMFYLKQGLQQKGSITGALYRYNPSNVYVQTVLERSKAESPTVRQADVPALPTAAQQADIAHIRPHSMAELSSFLPEQPLPGLGGPISTQTAASSGGLLPSMPPVSTIGVGPSGQQVQPPQGVKMGFWPYALSVLALVGQGNVGPLLGLMEQERKTKVMQMAGPALEQVNRLRNEGKYGEAQDLLAKTLTGAGSRSQEVAQYAIQQMGEMRKEVDDINQARAWYNTKSAGVTADNPNLPTYRELYNILQSGRPGEARAALEMLKTAPIVRDIQGGVGQQQIDPVTGRPGPVMPVRLLANKDDLSHWGWQQFQFATNKMGLNLGQGDIINVLNGVPVEREGRNITTPQVTAMMKAYQSYLSGYGAQLEAAKTIPLSPESVWAMLNAGIQPFDIATRNIQISQQGGDQSKAMEEYERIITLRETAQLKGKSNLAGAQGGIPVVDMTGKYHPYVSADDVIKSPALQAQLVPLRNEGELEPLGVMSRLTNKLDILKEMVQTLPSLNGPVGERVKYFAGRYVHGYFPFDETTSARQVAEAIAGNEYEKWMNDKGMSSEANKQAKAQFVSAFTTRENALAAINQIDRTVKEDLATRLYQQGVRSLATPPQSGMPTLPQGTVPQLPMGPTRLQRVPTPGQ